MATLITRIKKLEQQAEPVFDIAVELIAARRRYQERCRLGLPHPPSKPIVGNSPLADALRAARKRCGIT